MHNVKSSDIISLTYFDMAFISKTWYTSLDFDSYVLDLLLLGWCVVAAMVVICVKSVKIAISSSTKQVKLTERFRDLPAPVIDTLGLSASQRGESCKWFNTVLCWTSLHYYHTPLYLDEWVKALNLQLAKLGGPVHNRVDSIEQGGLPPRFSDITCQRTADDGLLISVKLESRELLLTVFASQHLSEGVRMTSCVCHVLKLNGVLQLRAYIEKKDVKLTVNFGGQPEVWVEVKPSNPNQDMLTSVDTSVVMNNIRNALILTSTTITITQLLMPGDLSSIPGACLDDDLPSLHPGELRVRASDAGWGMSASDIALLNQRFTAKSQNAQVSKLMPSTHRPAPHQMPSPAAKQVTPKSHLLHMPEAACVRSAQRDSFLKPSGSGQAAVASNFPTLPHSKQLSGGSVDGWPVTGRQSGGHFEQPDELLKETLPMHSSSVVLGDRRLYVKVIKANFLRSAGEGAVNAICYVTTDRPYQRCGTSVISNAANPFWDEHFLLEITGDTNEIRFDVCDRDMDGVGRSYPTGTVDVWTDVCVDDNRVERPGDNASAVHVVIVDGVQSVTEAAIRELSTSSCRPRTPITTKTLIITGIKRTAVGGVALDDPSDGCLQSDPHTDHRHSRLDTSTNVKKRFFWKRFGRKGRSHSVGRPTGCRSDVVGLPGLTECGYGRHESKDDLELVCRQPKSPTLKKSRSFGGSLRRLFKRGRKSRSRLQGNDTSRDSSASRGSGHFLVPCHDGSPPFQAADQEGCSTVTS